MTLIQEYEEIAKSNAKHQEIFDQLSSLTYEQVNAQFVDRAQYIQTLQWHATRSHQTRRG